MLLAIIIALITSLPSYSKEIREWYILLKKDKKNNKRK